ncbi:hypothetical protein BH11BAC3_BH11BAC3_27120 [soil metagenome]
MKKMLLVCVSVFIGTYCVQAQITQINSNRSLQADYPLSNNKSVYVSATDQTLWVTDGTLAGTIQLSNTIKFIDDIGSIVFLDGKLIFAGNTLAEGNELFITDGTPAGTKLLKDINPGIASSSPDYESALLNGYIYFTAERPAEGRELWRTDGTPGGTTLVKDIVTGPNSSNYPGKYHLFSNGSYLLLMAKTPSFGVELWRSDGTDAGTFLLKDINPHNDDSSSVQLFYKFNNLVLFRANTFAEGNETWKTDGIAGGTTILKDINPGSTSSSSLFSFPYYFTFNNHAYFSADDGTNGNEIWYTDGTMANTFILKNIEPLGGSSFDILPDAVIVGNKFIFPSTDLFGSRYQLWESDGTPGGTQLFKDFDGTDAPVLFIAYNINSPTFAQQLFQGNKFLFMASTATQGNELWISDGVDGTVTHTHIVKEINPGIDDGIDPSNGSYIYTSAGLHFPANNGSQGLELWKSDGTAGGTNIVADLVTGMPGSKPDVNFWLTNGKILFEANNGDDLFETDLYAVDGTFTPLPITLADFTVTQKSADAILQWHTLQEFNSRDFVIQRSFDGIRFENAGTVAAAGTSANSRAYSFTDVGVINNRINTIYYRLLSTDKDGKSAISPVIVLKLKNTGAWTIKLAANPVRGNIKVILAGIKAKVQLSIMDMTGKRIYSNSIPAVNGQISLPIDNVATGTYLLIAESDGEKRTLQFVK